MPKKPLPSWAEIKHPVSGRLESVVFAHEGMRVVIHHHLDYPPDWWLLSAREFGVDKKKLEATEIEAAKEEARLILLERALMLRNFTLLMPAKPQRKEG